jgi:UDP:flavonoid glycosyltransferase YjiC (YdhE family)
LPENILLFAKVPQIELLKRASLFITHAGQNSTSETIQYGVPVIAIPLVGDQILCANRMCADLGLGVQFDAMKLEVGKLADAIENVLTTESFREKTIELGKISRKYDGVATSLKLVLEILNSETNSNA